MKIKLERLKSIVRSVVQEAAAEGKFQNYAKVGKSAPPGSGE